MKVTGGKTGKTLHCYGVCSTVFADLRQCLSLRSSGAVMNVRMSEELLCQGCHPSQ